MHSYKIAITIFSGFFLFLTLHTAEIRKDIQEFSFGVIADCQYCRMEGTGSRKYHLSEVKLRECITRLNTLDLEFAIHLGDFIDRDFCSFNIVCPIFKQLRMNTYHVLGNHDFMVEDQKKATVPEKLGMPSKYYDFKIKKWRFIILDGNDISLHAFPKNSIKFKKAEIYYKQRKIKSPKWNGAIGPLQVYWLKKVLDKASGSGEKVIIFCHFPVFPENIHNLWNAGEILEIMGAYPCIKAYISGHNHKGNYTYEKNIHYLTLKGMVDTDKTSYAVINILKDRLEVTGYGRENNRVMRIN